MSDEAEKIHTPQLRFKVATVAAVDQQVKQPIPKELERQPTVVDESNLAALFSNVRPTAEEKSAPRPWIFI